MFELPRIPILDSGYYIARYVHNNNERNTLRVYTDKNI